MKLRLNLLLSLCFTFGYTQAANSADATTAHLDPASLPAADSTQNLALDTPTPTPVFEQESSTTNSADNLVPLPLQVSNSTPNADEFVPLPLWAFGLLFPHASSSREVYQAVKATNNPVLLNTYFAASAQANGPVPSNNFTGILFKQGILFD